MQTSWDRSKLAELQELTGGDPAWVSELLETYVADTRARLVELRDAVRVGAVARVQRAAHGIKGSSGNVGAARMAETCHRLESVERDGSVGRMGELLSDVEAAFEAMVEGIPPELRRR